MKTLAIAALLTLSGCAGTTATINGWTFSDDGGQIVITPPPGPIVVDRSLGSGQTPEQQEAWAALMSVARLETR